MNKIARAAPDVCFSSVLIVDDHPMYSDALALAMETVFPDCRIEKAKSLSDAVRTLERSFAPDLVIFDLKLPDVTGISGFVQLRSRLPNTPILIVSALASLELVQSLLREGAAGFLQKDASADKLRGVLGQIAAGQRYVPKEFELRDGSQGDRLCEKALNPKLAALTPQQQKIVRLICAGKPNKQIAYELSLAEATVKAHITALLRRLGVRNRTQVAVMMEAAQSEEGGTDPEARAFLNH